MANPLFDALIAPHRGKFDTFAATGAGETSYGAFHAAACRAAGAITGAGLGPGDRLVAQVGKSLDALALYGGCLAAGVVFVPLNPAYTTAEMDYFIGDAGPGLVVCDPDDAEALGPVAARHGARLLTLDAHGGGSFAASAAGKPDAVEPADRAPGDLAAFLYTSGTTGRSKGAMLTHENLLSNAASLCEGWRITRDDVLLHALPIFHTHGLFVAVDTVLLTGASMIFLPRFDVDAVLDALPRATIMMGVPTFYTRLLDAPGFDRAAARHMRLFVSGSAPLLSETHRTFEARTGHRILERYGLTETGMNTSNPYAGERRAGTVGLPLPGVEIRVTSGGRVLPAGETGGIEVRGPNVFAGYWRMPEKTAADLAPDGWFATGDLGRIDDTGYLEIVGRAKDLVISGGYNVYPKEIEGVLDDLPGIRESAVIGVPHPDYGEAVLAVLVPDTDNAPDLDGVDRALAGRLAGYKRPKRLVLVPDLPRNAMGKVQKAQLRETYRDLFAEQPG